ncbi:sodium/glutamate symport protein [Vibrio astriarenae]|nr:sodium/glutamate symport protein [Vibrio sp. C7]
MLGTNYDAAVMASGHAGFGLGATPTAMLNMNSMTSFYGASPKAYFIVPLVGAFFIDLSNLLVIEIFLHFLNK